MTEKIFLGIDVGSTTLKAVVINDREKVLDSLYKRTQAPEGHKISCTGRCASCGACSQGMLRKNILDFLDEIGLSFDDISCTAVTGSQIVDDTKRFIHYDFQVSEVSAHVAGARHFFPDCKAILDVGGQDSKAMLYNESMGMWTSKMSGICAAGTGAFLDSVAVKLNISVNEMSERINYDSDLEFSSVCAVLSATSINKFKNKVPLGQIIGGACRAQARTIMSGVGEIFYGYKGDIVFQGGVAHNRAVAYYLKEITGNNIIIPEFHSVMGALGAACIARNYHSLRKKVKSVNIPYTTENLKSVIKRAKLTRKEFFSKRTEPLVWRNLFFPPEILNALGVRTLTLETYAALFARNNKKMKKAFDEAASKGFSAETCSFLRVLEGVKLPKPDFGLSTSQPCQQGERIFRDLVRSYDTAENFYSLHTPITINANTIEHIAEDLEHSVRLMEKSMGLKLDYGRLQEACHLSNEARAIAEKCNDLRFTNPPLIRGSKAVYFSVIFSQLWGKKELIELQELFYEDLMEARERVDKELDIEDTHRLLWLHLPPFYNDDLLNYIENKCKAPIVFEEVNYIGWKPLNPEDPYRSLAEKLITVGFLDPESRVKSIARLANYARFNGCVLYNHMFGRCSMADTSFQKHLREELKKENIPLLVLDGDCVDPTIDPCSTVTKVSSYIEALNQKKYGNVFGPVS